MSKKKLVKPKKQIKEYYDYHKCRDYLQEKFGYNERDYAGRFNKKGKRITKVTLEIPYQDFWHWVLDKHEVHNGSFLTFDRQSLKYYDEDKTIKPWQREIYCHYLDEFADEKGELEMYVWW